MNKINFRKERIPFTQVSNEVLQSDRISLKAKGLYAYLQSKPEGWDFAIDRIAKEAKEERRAVNSGLQELEEVGLLVRKKLKTGKMEYILKSKMSKTAKKPDVQNGTLLKRHFAKMDTIINKEEKEIKNKRNKEYSEEASQGRKVNEYIEILKPLNPVGYVRWFKNKTQRASVEILVKQFTEGQLKHLVAFIIANRGKKFFPTITTPTQLVDKIPQLENFYKSKGYQKATEVVM